MSLAWVEMPSYCGSYNIIIQKWQEESRSLIYGYDYFCRAYIKNPAEALYCSFTGNKMQIWNQIFFRGKDQIVFQAKERNRADFFVVVE